MKSDVHGVSTCPAGQEQWEEFESSLLSRGRRHLPAIRVQYDYRTPEGELFSCIAKTLEEARQRRDKWLADKQ